MGRAIVAVAAVALMAAAAFLPIVAAHEPDERAERRAHDRGVERRAEHRDDHRGAMANATPFHLEISGTGVDAENATYTITLVGDGRARLLQREGNLSGMKGLARLHGTIVDANGTVVKDGNVTVMVRARETEDGQWRWQLVSRGETRFAGVPKLLLRGGATGPADGALELDGAGFALVKPDQPDSDRLRLRLDVTGMVTRANATA